MSQGICTTCTGLLLLLSSCRFAAPTNASGDVTSLALNTLVQKTLPPGERHVYQLAFTAQQYSRVQLNHSGIRIRVDVYAPAGELLQTLSGLQPGRLPFSAVPTQSGNYRLVVQSLEATSYTGSYDLRWVEQRRAQPEDAQRVAADAASARAEQHRTEATRAAWLAAQASYESAAAIWRKLGDNHEAARAFQRLGEIQQQLGDEAALASWQQAYALCRPEEELALELQNQMFALQHSRDGRCQQWLEESRARQFKRAEALALDNLGELAYTNDPRLSRQYYGESLALWRTMQDRQKQAAALYHRGTISAFLAESPSALEEFTAALSLYREINDKPGIAATLSAWGHQQNLLGKKQAALQLYEEALQQIEAFGDLAQRISVYNGKGFVYDTFGEYANALNLYEQAWQIARQTGDERSRAGAQLNMGDMHRQLGQPAQALIYLQEAFGLIQPMNNQLYYRSALLHLGLTHEALGEKTRALTLLRTAADLAQKSEDLRGAARLCNEMGRIYQTTKQLAEAQAQHTQALLFSQQSHDPFTEAQTRYYLARTEHAAGNTAAALTQIQAAIVLIEQTRAEAITPALRVSYLASVHQTYELNVELLMRQQQTTPEGNFAAEALTRSEQSRARSLLDLLNEARHDIKQGVDVQLLTQQRALLQARNSKANRQMQLQGNPEKAAEFAQIRREVEELSAQLNELDAKIRAAHPQYAALTQPQPLAASAIQQLLDDDTMLLEYDLGEESSYLWAVTKTSLDAYQLPPRATIEPLVRDLYQWLTSPPHRAGETAAQWHQRVTRANEQYWPRAAELSQMLLGPVAEKLAHKRLVIVGDEALQVLPFAALPEPVVSSRLSVVSKTAAANRQPTTDNRQPLIVHHEITNLPSASALQLLRAERQKQSANSWWTHWSRRVRLWFGGGTEAARYSVAMIADPVFGKEDKRLTGQASVKGTSNSGSLRAVDLADENLPLPRLIATREEAEEIRKAAGTNPFLLKQGFDATRAWLESDEVQPYSVLHFATHGFWDSTNPELSGIFLSRVDRQGHQLDGTLRLSDIYNLKLPKELVVLSACETALGKDIRGEGLMALTRGFMYAGATRVMASLWKVEDDATAQIMKEFYHRLLQEKSSPAAALRQAQLAQWRTAPTQVPYNWAAFVLQGEYR